MKRLVCLVIALCLMLTACSKKPEPQVTEPMTVDDLSTLYADWSKLEPIKSETAKLSYYEPRSEDGHLQPQDNYGKLLPYVGVENSNGYPRRGLVTTDGKIVTEPVYEFIYFADEFLLMTRREVYEFPEEIDWFSCDVADRYTVAALDGSWVRDLGVCPSDTPPITFGDGYLAAVRMDSSVIVINKDGELIAEFPRSLFEPYLGTNIVWFLNDPYYFRTENDIPCIGYRYNDGYKYIYLNIENGTVSEEPPYAQTAESTAKTVVPVTTPNLNGYTKIRDIQDPITGKLYFEGCIKTDEESRNYDQVDLLDENGELLLEDYYDYFSVRNGFASAIRDGFFQYYSLETGELVFSYPIRSDLD